MDIYTVQSGDTLYSIAGRFGVPEGRIATDNFIPDPSRLTVGRSLIIQYPSETYTVSEGDTLFSIAAATDTTLTRLWQNNPSLGGRTDIYPGQVINVRYGGEKLGEIAANGYAYPFVNENVLRATLPFLTYLSIFSYGFLEDGSLIEPIGGDDKLLALAREYGTVPMLTLTSITPDGTFSTEKVDRLLASPEHYRSVARSLAESAAAKGYGGVDLDFEYIPTDHAEAYADFAGEVKRALPAGYELFVSLAPKTSATQPGILYEGHRYDLLGEVADRVLLMTYEWGYKYGPPLAVSPLPQVERVLRYGVSEIEPGKIFMGVPNYAYDWRLPYLRGETVARTISNEEALTIAAERRAQIGFDGEAATPYFNYYAEDPTGETAEHVVWFDDARSMAAKLELIDRFALGGGGVWNVMYFFPALWTLLNAKYDIRKIPLR